MANTSAKSFREYLNGESLFKIDPISCKILPQTTDLVKAWETIFQNIFDGNIDTTSETPIGRLIETLAVRDARACAVTASYANQINPNYATGFALDAIASLFNLERNGAMPTTIVISVSGVIGTIIPSGKRIKNSAGLEFYVLSNITIGDGGVATGYAVSVDSGAIDVESGTVTEIVDEVTGWNSVTNTGIFSAGYDIESDYHLRNRILGSRWTGTSFTKSILSAIEKVDGVSSVIVVDNGNSTSQYLSGKDMKLHASITGDLVNYPYVLVSSNSILVIAQTNGTDDKVAKAIFENKSAGCGYTSITGQSVTKYVTDETSGVDYEVIFNRPLAVNFGVKVEVARNKYTGSDAELIADIKDAIKRWSTGDVEGVDGLRIGQSVYSYEIGSAISDQIKSIQIKSVLLTQSGVADTSKIDIFVDKIGVLNDANIEVTVS